MPKGMAEMHNTYRFRERPVATVRARLAIVCAVTVIVGVTLGMIAPRFVDPLKRLTGGYVAVGPAASALRGLAVRQSGARTTYSRDLFQFRSMDDDGDGCDVREEVLARDLADVVFDADGCTVRSGTLADPYTGASILFRRGRTTSAKVQIDHVVALRNAWISGADGWSTERRIEYANDPANLLAVDGASNQEKSDASADAWLPPNQDFRCEYVAMQIAIKSRYGLSVTAAERDAMMDVLAQCPADVGNGSPTAAAQRVLWGRNVDTGTPWVWPGWCERRGVP